MSLNTARRNLPYMEGTDLASDIDQGFEDLANSLDTQIVAFTQGTFASRPAAGTSGTLYFATDLLTLYYDNGTTWYDIQDLLPAGEIVNADVSSSAAITYSKLSLASSILNADISSSAAIQQSKLKNGTVVTSLPSSPSDGDECYYRIANGISTQSVIWHLKYRSAGGTYKWEPIGGRELFGRTSNSNAIASATYTDPAAAGPTITVPLDGNYLVCIGADLTAPLALAEQTFMSVEFGGTAAVDADSIASATGTIGSGVNFSGNLAREWYYTALTAGMVLTAKYRTTAGGGGYVKDRWMSLKPVNVG